MKYKNLLSPLQINNHVLKNRLTASPSKPQYCQGPEPYPADSTITHYANKARNGAALITCNDVSPVPLNPNSYFTSSLEEQPWMQAHSIQFDLFEGRSQHYLSQLTESVHFYGSKILANLSPNVPPGFDVSSDIPSLAIENSGMSVNTAQEISERMLDDVLDNYEHQVTLLKSIGFDGVFLHMAYRFMFLGRFVSPLTNKRQDQFGGCLENRARFPVMVADRIKKACGKDFIIEASFSGAENLPGGYLLEDAVEYAKIFSGHIDMLQIRTGDIEPAHPTGFMDEKTPYLHLAEAIKRSGTPILVGTVGGYQDLDLCEEVISQGKADYIAMARSWISNPDYGRKVYEGRGEDVVPCIRCNKCHRSSHTDPWVSVCSVNPVWGFEHRIHKMIDPPTGKKKVAIVGGGPAGMEAALVLSDRGHEVTLFEKSDVLGGLLNTANHVSFKWPVKEFKEYLVRKIGQSAVKVLLSTEAGADLLKKDGYDVVLAGVGSEPIVPSIPGVGGKNVFLVTQIFGHEESLAEKVVIVGGGEAGVEIGMHLAEKAHKVTVLEMQDKLAADSTPLHFYSMFRDAWEELDNFEFILQAKCNRIENNRVFYIHTNGKEYEIEANSVVIAVGMKPRSDLALQFKDASDNFYLIGDCHAVGNIQKSMRSAFGIASMI